MPSAMAALLKTDKPAPFVVRFEFKATNSRDVNCGSGVLVAFGGKHTPITMTWAVNGKGVAEVTASLSKQVPAVDRSIDHVAEQLRACKCCSEETSSGWSVQRKLQ